MADSKVRPEGLQKLFLDANDNQQDKQIIEALRKRLNELLTNDPKACQKAALVLESWLHQKPKK